MAQPQISKPIPSEKRAADSPTTNIKKQKTNSTTLGYGQQRNPEEEGYSLRNNITPLYSHNYLSRSNLTTVIYTLKNKQWIDFNCCENGQKASIIPYKNMQFWTNEKTNQTIFNGLMKLSTGWEILSANINIENHSICRQRLITQGSTTVLTYDFETSQNLIIGHLTHGVYLHKPSINTTKEQIRKPIQTELEFFTDYDEFTYEEIPQKHIWHYNVPTSKLNKQGLLINTEETININHLIPGETNYISQLNSDNTTKFSTITNQTYLYDQIHNQEQAQIQVTRTADYPQQHGIFIGQPRVADETGYMKFRYQIQLETALTCKFHLEPDNNPTIVDSIINNAQHIKLPTTQTSAPNATTLIIPYIGYRIHV